MKSLIRKILKESEDEFGWVDDIVSSYEGDHEPSTIYFKFGDTEITRNLILAQWLPNFRDLRVEGGKIIMKASDGWCDFTDLFYEDRRGSEGYVNRYLAKNVLCEDDMNWWHDYSVGDLIPKHEWKRMIWDDLVLGNEKVLKEVLSHIKRKYVSTVDYNPKQLDIYGELPKKQNVVEIRGRVLDTDYFYELTNDVNELGKLIDKEDEFIDLKRELSWAYGDAYNNAAQGEIWKATVDIIKENFGEGTWVGNSMEFDVTDLFWDSVIGFLDNCLDNCVGNHNKDNYSMEELDERCEECSPVWNHSYFINFYAEYLNETEAQYQPRYDDYPDDTDVEENFVENVIDRL